jgi:two-component system OmpR family response regulator
LRILLIEDDLVLGAALQKGLTESGHECEWTASGASGAKLAAEALVDVVILDLLLPDLPGLEVLKQLRASRPHLAVLMLTASGAIEERVLGLNSGADDYMVKPFAFAELIARLAALGRRKAATTPGRLEAGSLTIDLASRVVKRGDRELELTPTEYKLLEYLVRNAGQVVTRRMLCEHLWDSDWEGVTNVIEVHINRLRNKLNKGFGSDMIQTIRGRGYALYPD